MGYSSRTQEFLVESRLADAARGNVDAYYDLGMAYSSGSMGLSIDLIEAHKWFNLAALAGNSDAQGCRAEIASEMSSREIAAAQRQARSWLSMTVAQAA